MRNSMDMRIIMKIKDNIIQLKTSEEWQKECTIIIIDADG
jgi:hypothetical protein